MENIAGVIWTESVCKRRDVFEAEFWLSGTWDNDLRKDPLCDWLNILTSQNTISCHLGTGGKLDSIVSSKSPDRVTSLELPLCSPTNGRLRRYAPEKTIGFVSSTWILVNRIDLNACRRICNRTNKLDIAC